MRGVFAVTRYRLREAAGLRRWLALPPIFFVAAWLAADPLRFDGGDDRRLHDGIDTILYDLTDGRILVLVLGGAVLLFAGDAVQRSHRTGALSYILVRCRRRGMWWLGEMIALAVLCTVMVLVFLVCAGLAGTIRLGTVSVSGMGTSWIYDPGLDLLPRQFPFSRLAVVLLAALPVVSMCTILGALVMSASLVLRPVAVLPLAGVALIGTAMQRAPSGIALDLHPVFSAPWLQYVSATTAQGVVTAAPALTPVAGAATHLAWLAGVLVVGLWLARRFDPRPR